MIDFARTWASFGGPPNDAILIRFGMSPTRFTVRLREIVAETDRSNDFIGALRKVGPQPDRAEPID
ncbi:hypothetical protein [Rhodococcus sp. NPDC057529]|uniref:hypothetical protein n=1 Tax=Rhodococcus sp. NPDC057529 TaxID=3346158 RepID=UPI00366C9286